MKIKFTGFKFKFFILAILFFVFLLLIFTDIKKIIAQNSNILRFYVYPEANYNYLGNIVAVGTSSINTSNLFNKFYNLSPFVTVLDKSFYRLEIPATNNINLSFDRIEPSPTSSSMTADCLNLNGRIENNRCVIEGMLFKTISGGDYELWSLRARRGSTDLGTIYFYLVSSTVAQTQASARSDQYYLIPEATSVILTNTRPSSTINYSIYYKKLYCNQNLANAETFISSSPSLGSFIGFSFNNTDFSNNIFISKPLSIDRVNSNNYSLFLKRRGDQSNQSISNRASITVDNRISPPILFISCQVNPTSGLRINSSSIYTLEVRSNEIIGNASFTLRIATTGGLYRIFTTSTLSNSSSTSVATSVIWTASGTYYATSTVQALGITTSTQCSQVDVESCRCLYRQSGASWQRRCQQNSGVWESWQDYSGDIDPNCNCNRREVRNIYENLCN